MSSRLMDMIAGTFPVVETAQEVLPRAPLLKKPCGLCTDEELAERLRAADGDALATLFKRYGRLVYNVARRILRVEAESEDCMQQIFLDVFRAIDQFDPGKGSFKTWLLMFAYHRTLNRRRSLMAAHFFDTDSIEELLPELLQPVQRDGYRVLDRMVLEQALGTLQPRQRVTIELTYYEGLTAEEISTRTGETVRVVRHNLYRGLEKLRQLLCHNNASHGGAR
jgi:RNA polymerase sigma-70 factor (ECF subfamily)